MQNELDEIIKMEYNVKRELNKVIIEKTAFYAAHFA